jgi:hypothetical protein
MKNIRIVIISSLSVIAFIAWFYLPSNKQLDVTNETSIGLLPAEEANHNKMKLLNKQKKQATHPKSNEELELVESEAIHLAETLFSNIINKQAVDFSAEKRLINYLKESNNEQVYHFIVDALNSVELGSESGDRLTEYGLSLLAAVDSLRASEVFFDFVGREGWQQSSAIYIVSKSISKLASNDAYKNLAQQTFTQAKDDNPFIGELAKAIAYNPQEAQVDYLISYVDTLSKSKSTGAVQAMRTIHEESLVPHIVSYTTDNSSSKVQKAALNSLANMGQYEAASALITWSSTQSKDSTKEVEKLFITALGRSPSTKRAIDKEIHLQEFDSDNLKELIIKLSNDGVN